MGNIELIMDLIKKNYGFSEPMNYKLVNADNMCSVYIIYSAGNKYIVKIKPDFFINNEKAIDFMGFLHENDLKVPKIIKTKQNKSYICIPEFIIEVHEYISNDTRWLVSNPRMEEIYISAAALLGTYHTIAHKYNKKIQNPVYFYAASNKKWYGRGIYDLLFISPIQLGQKLVYSISNTCENKYVKDAVVKIINRIADIQKNTHSVIASSHILINHGDFHIGNILYKKIILLR